MTHIRPLRATLDNIHKNRPLLDPSDIEDGHKPSGAWFPVGDYAYATWPLCGYYNNTPWSAGNAVCVKWYEECARRAAVPPVGAKCVWKPQAGHGE